jgi:hypothetical protein
MWTPKEREPNTRIADHTPSPPQNGAALESFFFGAVSAYAHTTMQTIPGFRPGY